MSRFDLFVHYSLHLQLLHTFPPSFQCLRSYETFKFLFLLILAISILASRFTLLAVTSYALLFSIQHSARDKQLCLHVTKFHRIKKLKMVFAKTWEDFEIAAEAMLMENPQLCRYSMKYAHTKPSLILKVTNNAKVS